MPNELLKTLTIDGVANDALGVGDFIHLDADNQATLQLITQFPEDVSISVPNKSALMSNIYTFTEEGWFVGYMKVAYPSNANGIRSLQGYSRGPSSSTDFTLNSALNIPAASGGPTILTIPFVTSVENGSIAKARLWQNSGSALSAAVRIAGYLIKK